MTDRCDAGIIASHHSVGRLRQVQGTLLADNLTLDIISVPAVYKRFHVNANPDSVVRYMICGSRSSPSALRVVFGNTTSAVL